MSDAPRPGDLAALVARVRAAARARGRARPAASAGRLADYQARLAGARELVLAADTAVELGSPRRRSAHAVLWTTAPGQVVDDQFVVVGPDLDAAGPADRAYAQLTLVEVEEARGPRLEARGGGSSLTGLEPSGSRLAPQVAGLDVARLEAQQFLTRRLPGLMARMLPGRLWLRASRDAVAAGLDFALLAAALRAACRAVAPADCRGASPSAPRPLIVRAVECVFASGADEDVADFAALAAEARVHTGRHHRLALGADGAFECPELACEACDDQPVCDRIRAATAIRRRAPAPPPAASARREGGA